MFDLDVAQEIASSLARHKLRTTLTALGVFFGIFIFVAMVAFGPALKGVIQRQMRGFAANSVFMFGGRTSEPFAGLAPNRPVQFDNDDIEPLRRLAGVEYLAPRHFLGGFRGGAVIKRQGKTGSFGVAGDYPAYQHIASPIMRAGRYINDIDIAEKRKIAVIGESVAAELFARGENPIGGAIEVAGIQFVVVGVFGTRATGAQGDQQVRTVHLPFTTFQQAFNMGNKVAFFAISGTASTDANGLEQRARAVLSERHKVAPTDTNAIHAWNLGAAFAKQARMSDIVNVVLSVAGFLSLLAGAIGVSNIMLISVRERTKEIGVRKALGASPASVVGMVIAEAVALTTLAGYLGLVFGVGMVQLAAYLIARAGPEFPLGPPSVSFGFALLATGVLVVAGALAGLIPAARAAAISPVEALRDE